jgi:hypothetical protein
MPDQFADAQLALRGAGGGMIAMMVSGHNNQPEMNFVMPGHSPSKTGVNALLAGIHVFSVLRKSKTWMAGSSPAMTRA